jgi:hypothetical protein
MQLHMLRCLDRGHNCIDWGSLSIKGGDNLVLISSQSIDNTSKYSVIKQTNQLIQHEVHQSRTRPFWRCSRICFMHNHIRHSQLRCTLLSPLNSKTQHKLTITQVACLNSAATVASCATTDYACQCSSSASSVIASLAYPCAIDDCGLITALEASSAAHAVCTACA